MNPYADVPPILRKGGDRPIDKARYVVYGTAFGEPMKTTVDAPDERIACGVATAKARRQGFTFRATHAKREAFRPTEFERVHGISVHAEAGSGNTCPTCGCAIADESKACRAHAERVGFAPTVQPEMRAWHERKSEYTPRREGEMTLSDDALDIFLEASITGDGGGAIERQEARGQQRLARSQTLPIDGTTQPRWGRESAQTTLEGWGFVFGKPVDELFVACTFPEGWSIRPTDHSMWSDLVDADGVKRGSMFYKAAFYDRSAFFSLESQS